MVRKVTYIMPSIILTLIVGWLCLSPRVASIGIKVNDKTAHILAFSALGAVYSLAFVRGFRSISLINGLVVGFFVAVVYGGLIEILQENLIPGRYGEFYDWLADILGSLIGVIVARVLFKTKYIALFSNSQ